MKKLIAITMLAGLALAPLGQAGFIKTWAFPGFSGTDANPYTYADGNQWGAYLAGRDEQAATLTPLTWANDEVWKSGNAQYWPNIYGGWNGTPKIRGGAYDVGALTFSPGVSGVYSLTGSAVFYQSAGYSSITFQIYKISGATTTELYNIGQTEADILVFANVTSLQNVALATGDRLVFLAQSGYGGTFGEVRLADAGIGLAAVPEPASLLLLGLCAVGFLKRRAA
jgi:hypothetical protein